MYNWKKKHFEICYCTIGVVCGSSIRFPRYAWCIFQNNFHIVCSTNVTLYILFCLGLGLNIVYRVTVYYQIHCSFHSLHVLWFSWRSLAYPQSIASVFCVISSSFFISFYNLFLFKTPFIKRDIYSTRYLWW